MAGTTKNLKLQITADTSKLNNKISALTGSFNHLEKKVGALKSRIMEMNQARVAKPDPTQQLLAEAEARKKVASALHRQWLEQERANKIFREGGGSTRTTMNITEALEAGLHVPKGQGRGPTTGQDIANKERGRNREMQAGLAIIKKVNAEVHKRIAAEKELSKRMQLTIRAIGKKNGLNKEEKIIMTQLIGQVIKLKGEERDRAEKILRANSKTIAQKQKLIKGFENQRVAQEHALVAVNREILSINKLDRIMDKANVSKARFVLVTEKGVVVANKQAQANSAAAAAAKIHLNLQNRFIQTGERNRVTQQKLLMAHEKTTKVLRSQRTLWGRITQDIKQFNRRMLTSEGRTKLLRRSLGRLTKENKAYVRSVGAIRGHTEGWQRVVGRLRNQILLVTFAMGSFIATLKGSVEAAKLEENAMTGLIAVGEKFGISSDKSTAAAQEFTKTGLLSIKDAADSLKNLYSAGFGQDEANALLLAGVEAAAFNRQGTLSLGQAVVGYTQGLKNQNSIMVDNAGITKNLSIMYKEFATSIGTTAGKLSEVEKRQAILNGILREGSVFVGNMDKLTKTFSGSMSKMGVTVFQVKAEIGRLIQPVLGKYIDKITAIVAKTRDWLTENKKINQEQISNALDNVGKSAEFVADTFKLLFNILKGINNVIFQGTLPAFAKLFFQMKIGLIIYRAIGKGVLSLTEKLKVQKTATTSAKTAMMGANIATNSWAAGLLRLSLALGKFLLVMFAIEAAVRLATFLYNKYNGAQEEAIVNSEEQVKWGQKEVFVIDEKVKRIEELEGATDKLNKKSKIEIELLKTKIKIAREESIAEFIQLNNGEKILNIMKEKFDLTKINNASQEELLATQKRVDSIILASAKNVLSAKRKIRAGELGEVKALEDIAKKESEIIQIRKGFSGRGEKNTLTEQQLKDVTRLNSEIRNLKNDITGTYTTWQEEGKLTELEHKQLLRLQGELAQSLSAVGRTGGEALDIVDAKLRAIRINLEDLRTDIERAFRPEDETTFGKLLEKHRDRVESLQDKYKALGEKMDAAKGITKKMREEFEKLGEILESEASSAKPKFKVEFAIEDLAKDLREASKKMRSKNILGEFLTGKTAIQSQKISSEEYGLAVARAVQKGAQQAFLRGGVRSLIEFMKLIPRDLQEQIQIATDHFNALKDIQADYYDFIDEKRRQDIDKYRQAEESKNNLLKILTDEKFIILKGEQSKEAEIRLLGITANKLAQEQFLAWKRQLGEIELANMWELEKEKAFVAEAGLAIRKGVETEFSRFFSEMTDRNKNEEKAGLIFAKNIAKATLAIFLDSIAQRASAKSAEAAWDAVAALGRGEKGKAAKLFAASAGYAALAGAMSGLASSTRGSIDSLNAVEEKTKDIKSNSITGVQTQAIGGLDLGPSFNTPGPSPSISNTVIFNAETIMIGNDIADNPDAIKQGFKSAINSVVNEGIETGEITK